MVVFRNFQGQFLPAMSDRDEFQYWRILKVGGSRPGEHIKGGDQVRLCWAFKDQTTGFRDFTQDAFGRRENQCPAELQSSVLFLKVPWPRFEFQGQPTVLVMSQNAKEEPVEEVLNVLPEPGAFKYCLQDITFRIDTVENSGKGDSGDYLLNGVQQQGDRSSMTIRPNGDALRMQQSIFWFGLHFG